MTPEDFARHATLLAKSVKDKEELYASLLDWFKLAMKESAKETVARERQGLAGVTPDWYEKAAQESHKFNQAEKEKEIDQGLEL
jgi:hypothetical protein